MTTTTSRAIRLRAQAAFIHAPARHDRESCIAPPDYDRDDFVPVTRCVDRNDPPVRTGDRPDPCVIVERHRYARIALTVELLPKQRGNRDQPLRVNDKAYRSILAASGATGISTATIRRAAGKELKA